MSMNTDHKTLSTRRSSPGATSRINPWLIGGFCLLISVLFLLVSSKCSPLYPFNDWVDANAFLTMGRGMFDGKVPYRDLFEQKGPLLYFIFGLGSLFSRTTFLGVFIFEVVSFSIFLFFCFQLMSLYTKDQYALIGLPVLAAAVLNLRSFGHGGSAEQFSLPLIAISLFYFIKYFRNVYPQPMPYNWLLLNGAVAGCILWIKYSFLGFWVGWIGAILLSLVVNKKFLLALKSAAFFLGGGLIATLPWMVYFGRHNGIRDWLQTYFIINLTSYPMNLTLRERMMVPIDSLQRHLTLNPAAVGLLILGVLVFITNKKYLQDWFSRIGLTFGVLLLVLGVYGGGRDYIYYFFIFAPFIIFGVIVILDLYHEAYAQIKSTIILFLLVFLALGGTMGYTLRFQRNTYMLGWDRETLVQYQYAAIINEKQNATLLNYGFQDGGFYTATGITPDLKFFQAQNIDYAAFPQVVDEQLRYVKEQRVDFIVMRYLASENTDNLPIPDLYENYQQIASQTQLFGETEFKYLLFKKVK